MKFISKLFKRKPKVVEVYTGGFTYGSECAKCGELKLYHKNICSRCGSEDVSKAIVRTLSHLEFNVFGWYSGFICLQSLHDDGDLGDIIEKRGNIKDGGRDYTFVYADGRPS